MKMSCNYAEGLSPYENKGILGLPEIFESRAKLEEKCEVLASIIRGSKHIVVHTGAGISTAAGIPDFRGPNGVWTLEREGKKPSTNISFVDAQPTRTHMILRKLVEVGVVKYIISQNIDALHMRSGLGREFLSELHGNMFIDQCSTCDRQFIRPTPVETVGKRTLGKPCRAARGGGRPCRGRLHDAVLDWEHGLPERELLMAEYHSSIADLSICLGTTLQIVPSGNLPLETLRYGGRLVICNLQPTKHDNKADLKINYYVDDILEIVIKHLNLKIPEYNKSDDPTTLAKDTLLEWTIDRSTLQEVENLYKSKCKGVKKKRILVKRQRQDVSNENLEDLQLDASILPKEQKRLKSEAENTSENLQRKSNISQDTTELNVKCEKSPQASISKDLNADKNKSITYLQNSVDSKPEEVEIIQNGTLFNIKCENPQASIHKDVNADKDECITGLQNGMDSKPEEVEPFETYTLKKSSQASIPEDVNAEKDKHISGLQTSADSKPKEVKITETITSGAQ